MEGLPMGSVNDFCRNAEENKTRESVFELRFTVGIPFTRMVFRHIKPTSDHGGMAL